MTRARTWPRARRWLRRIIPGTVSDPVERTWRRVVFEAARRGSEDPAVRDWQPRLADLRGSYSGQRCFIMGNGPSLNLMELDRFDGEIVWGSNRCSLLFERVKWRPRFYVAVDERVVPDTAREIAHLQQQLPDTRFFFPIHFRLRGTLGTTPNTTWYWQMPLREGRGAWGQFSRDPSRGVFEVRSVTVAALQLAVHLGFDPIYLFGCDTSYSVPASVRRDDGDPNGLTSTRDDDANHFDPAYFGAGRQWHEPHVDRMIEHYEFAKEACDELGVSVFNATVGGNLEVFPRVDYRDLV